MRKFVEKIDRADWRNAMIGGVVVGALPVVGFGWFLLDDQVLNDPQATILFGLFLLVAIGMFAVTGGTIILLFSVMVRQWPRASGRIVAEYQAFAEAVGGKLQMKEPPWPLRLVGHLPQRVSFSHNGRVAELEIVSESVDGSAVTYTRLTISLLAALGFQCRIYPSGVLSRVAEFFGAQRVHVGSRDFDERFTVKTDNEAQAMCLLTQEVQQKLSEFVDWAGTVRDRSVIGSDFVTFHIADESLRIELTGFLMTCDKLLDYTNRGNHLADAIARQIQK